MKPERQQEIADLIAMTRNKVGCSKQRTRFEEELAWIGQRGFAADFLYWGDVLSTLRRKGVLVGPGRGALGASYVAWVLGLSEIEPVMESLPAGLFLRGDRDRLSFGFDISTRRFSETDGLYYDVALDRIAQVKRMVGEFERERSAATPGLLEILKLRWDELDPSVSKEAVELLRRVPSTVESKLEISLALGRPGPQLSGMTSAFMAGSASDICRDYWPTTRGIPIFREQWLSLSCRGEKSGSSASRETLEWLTGRGVPDPRVFPSRGRSTLLRMHARWGKYAYLRSHAVGRARIGLLAARVASAYPREWSAIVAETTEVERTQ